MATLYSAAVGYNIGLLGLTAINPQPASPGVQVVQRNESASGSVHEHGLWIPLEWSMLDPETQYQALLVAFGLSTALTAVVTVYVPNHEYVWTLYSGLAVRPLQNTDIRRREYFIRDVTIIVKNLVVLGNISVSETVTVTDSPRIASYQLGVTQSVGVTEAVTLLIPTLHINKSESITITEAVARA